MADHPNFKGAAEPFAPQLYGFASIEEYEAALARPAWKVTVADGDHVFSLDAQAMLAHHLDTMRKHREILGTPCNTM